MRKKTKQIERVLRGDDARDAWRVRSLCLHFFGTSDPELLRDLWAMQADERDAAAPRRSVSSCREGT